jgi:hypothetical protein
VTDYQPLIARAVEGLDSHKVETRRALYERARTALVTQLRAVDPPLSESAIAKERLALEGAIRNVEADAARKAPARREHHAAAVSSQPIASGLSTSDRVAPSATTATARVQPPNERSKQLSALLSRDAIRSSRNITGRADGFGRATVHPSQSPQNLHKPYGSAKHYLAELGSESDPDDFSAKDREPQRSWLHREASHDREEGDTVPEVVPLQPLESEDLEPVSARNYRTLGYILLALIICAGLWATISWKWPHVTRLYRDVAQTLTKPSARPNEAASPPKFSGRAPQEQSGGQTPAEAAPGSATVPAAQRAVLYEEETNDPQGKRYLASVVWHTVTVSPESGVAPEIAVQADVEVPERHINITWTLRRNTSPEASASHTMEIKFNLPADFPGGIANVPGILMKQSEQTRGTALTGVAVKVANDFFLIGLSATDLDRQRNIQLLKESSWIDIPFIYTDGRRSILAMEKGPSGDRAFAEAFGAWETD